ncbi:MAG TPA: hypothetical protein VFP39_01915 [Gemmatimonadales bacterium]|nr:hypothetical protein [Gemmatimonadales bacterium]
MVRTRVPLIGGLAAAALATTVATCGRDTAAPRQPAALAVAATLPPGLNLAAFSLSIDHVRLIAVNSKGDTAFSQTFSFPANQSSLSLTADVPLAQSPETFQVTIELLSGTQVLFSGTQSVSLSSGPSNPTAQIPVSYSGPGQNVATLTLGPPDSLLTQGATLQMRVTAKDGVGANVPTFYVSWSTSDTVAAPIDATGTLKAPLLRKKITVQATTPTAVSATTTLQFVPVPSAVSFDSGCAQSGLPGVQLPQPIVARVLGGDGLGVPGVTVQFAALAGGSVGTPSAVTDTGGRARTLVTLPSVAGPAQFQATVTGLTAAVCGPTVLSSPPTQVAFKTQPATALAGAAIGSFQVEVRDASGALVSAATNAVTVAILNNAGGGTLSGTKTVNAVAGVATFTGLSLDKVGVGYTLQATASGLTSANSSAFNITPAALNSLAFTTQPVNLTAGTAFPTVVVTARDAFGNTVTSFTGNVTLAFGSHPANATLTGTTSMTAAAGVATFSALGPLPVAGGYTLVASASGVGSTASNSFTVNPAPPVALAFTVEPTTPLAGAIITPSVVVAVEDSVGNLVTSATNQITMGFALNPGQGPLGGTLIKNAASGLAIFTDLSVAIAASGYKLAASASGLATATSASFDVLVRPPGVVWINPSGGNWGNAANWSPARVPGVSDTASIVLPGSYVVNLDVNAHVAFLAVGDTIGGIILDVPVGRHILIDSSAVLLRAGSMVLAGSDTIGGPGNFTNQGALTMEGSAITTAFVSNTGSLQAAGASSITGSFSNSSGGVLFVYSSSTGDATLTISSGFLNAGSIVLDNADVAAHNATLAVTSGVLTNISGSSLNSYVGTAGGTRTLAAALNNQGLIVVQQTLTIDRDSASYSNTGLIVSNGGDLNVILSGFRPGFSNGSPGVIDIGTNKLVISNLSTGSFINQAGATLRGSGTIDIGTSSFITNGIVTVGVTSPAILTFTGPYLQGPSPSVLNVFLTSPTTPGTGFSQFQVSDTVNLQGGTLNATLTGPYTAGSYPVITVPTGKIIMGDFTTKTLPTNPLNGGQCLGAVSGTQYVITCPP